MAHDQDANSPAKTGSNDEQTAVGNYFVANYPPFSFWRQDRIHHLAERLKHPADPDTPFGLYVHIPFCRKRCDFCYFRVYTDKNRSAIQRYLDAVIAEAAHYARLPMIQGRRPSFVYFGGGTPSYLTSDQLRYLFDGLQQHLPWDEAQEITFECEPGTLQEEKIETLGQLGITRLSLGVENFDADILALNNRAHRAKEIHRAFAYARQVGFPQINIDLIAGMVGETDENWQQCIAETRAMAPESVTIYQMEVPYNTTIYRRMKDGGDEVAPVASWDTKRRWVAEAFAGLEEDGYTVGSAYTAKKSDSVQFRYRDALWHGADLLGLGVASFSHLGGIHAQNQHDFDPYIETVESGTLPIHRALPLTDDERLVREFVLQLKLGRLDLSTFRAKFGVEVLERFAEPLRRLQAEGHIAIDGDGLTVPRQSLLQIDPILQAFFRPEHQGARYA